MVNNDIRLCEVTSIVSNNYDRGKVLEFPLNSDFRRTYVTYRALSLINDTRGVLFLLMYYADIMKFFHNTGMYFVYVHLENIFLSLIADERHIRLPHFG